jgi:hypothetical protein
MVAKYPCAANGTTTEGNGDTIKSLGTPNDLQMIQMGSR